MKIKSFEGACKALKLDAKKLPGVTRLPKRMQKMVLAQYKLAIIAEALNDGWKPNWKDYDQGKYYPWFEMDSASGFRLSGVNYYYANSNVGSRLCFKSRPLAEYAAKQFFSLYKDLFTFNQ